MEPKRILIMDSHPLTAASLSVLLAQQPAFCTLACSSYAHLAASLESFCPSIVVMNLHHDAIAEGLDACRLIAATPSKHMIVLLAQRCVVESGTFILDAVEAGADGILTSEKLDLVSLLAALEDLEGGRSLLVPCQLREALANRRNAAACVPMADTSSQSRRGERPTRRARSLDTPISLPVAAKLTAREREVADLIATGASTGAIAEQLYISTRTVQCHISSILAKIGAHTRAEAVVRLYRWAESPAPEHVITRQV